MSKRSPDTKTPWAIEVFPESCCRGGEIGICDGMRMGNCFVVMPQKLNRSNIARHGGRMVNACSIASD